MVGQDIKAPAGQEGSTQAFATGVRRGLLQVLGALLVPALLLYLASAMVKLIADHGPRPTTGEIFNSFTYMFIPAGLSMHLAHNISHLLREGVEIVPAIHGTSSRVAGLELGEGPSQVAPLIGLEAQFWLQMLIIIILNGLSLYACYRIAQKEFGERAWRAFVPMALLAVGFMLVNVAILGQPMALRHTH